MPVFVFVPKLKITPQQIVPPQKVIAQLLIKVAGQLHKLSDLVFPLIHLFHTYVSLKAQFDHIGNNLIAISIKDFVI